MKQTIQILTLCGSLALISCESEEKKITKQPAPDVPSKATEILRDDHNAIQIRLSATEDILVEGKRIEPAELKSALQSAKNSKGDTATVVIHLKSNSHFGIFTEVHETLEELLQEERNSVSQQRFHLLFDQLNETQRKIITRTHHLRVIEKMNQ